MVIAPRPKGLGKAVKYDLEQLAARRSIQVPSEFAFVKPFGWMLKKRSLRKVPEEQMEQKGARCEKTQTQCESEMHRRE